LPLRATRYSGRSLISAVLARSLAFWVQNRYSGAIASYLEACFLLKIILNL